MAPKKSNPAGAINTGIPAAKRKAIADGLSRLLANT